MTDAVNDDAFEALQQFADVWHDKYAKPASAGENRKPTSLTMRANGVAAVLTEPQLGAAVAEYVRTRQELEQLRAERGEFRRQRNEWVSDMHAAFAAGLETPDPADVEQRWQLSQGWIVACVAERQAVRNGGNTP